jgi:hypothetical protein
METSSSLKMQFWGSRMKAQSRCVLVFAMLFVASTLCAQYVPPPPKPVPDGPSLAETLESLKQTLLSSAVPTFIKTYPPDTTLPGPSAMAFALSA